MPKKTTKKAAAKKPKPAPKNKGTKAKKDTRKTVELITDVSKLRKAAEFMEYLNFIALPRITREDIFGYSTEQRFAQSHGLGQDTLVGWKKLPGFWEDITTIRQAHFRERSGDVLLSLETKCLQPEKVNGQDVRVYLTAIGEYTEKVEEEHKLDPAVQEALAKVARALG